MISGQASKISINLKKQIFLTVVVISIISIAVLIPFDYFYLKSYMMAALDGISLIVFIVIFFFSKYRNKTDYLILPYIFYFLFNVNMAWYNSGGLNLPVSLIFLVITYISIVVIPSKYVDHIIVFIVLNLIILAAIEFKFPEIRRVPESELIEMIFFGFFIYVALFQSTFLLVYVKNQYNWARGQVLKQNELLGVQSKELTVLNEELRTLNIELESKVNKATDQLIEKNRKLIDYALMNSHNVRAPLARIQGLAELYKTTGLYELEKEQTLSYIRFSVIELEQEINKVNDQLEIELLG